MVAAEPSKWVIRGNGHASKELYCAGEGNSSIREKNSCAA